MFENRKKKAVLFLPDNINVTYIFTIYQKAYVFVMILSNEIYSRYFNISTKCASSYDYCFNQLFKKPKKKTIANLIQS